MEPKSVKKIAVIDDSSTNNLLLSSILEEEGYETIQYSSSKYAAKKLEKISPDLFLIDIMMPGMNGFELIEKIKEFDHLKNIPILVVSAKTDEDSKEKAKIIGANDYIEKPIKIPEFLSKIKNSLLS